MKSFRITIGCLVERVFRGEEMYEPEWDDRDLTIDVDAEDIGAAARKVAQAVSTLTKGPAT